MYPNLLTTEEHEAQNVLDHIIEQAEKIAEEDNIQVKYTQKNQIVQLKDSSALVDEEKIQPFRITGFTCIPNPPGKPVGSFHVFYTSRNNELGTFSDARGLLAFGLLHI